MIFLWPQVGMVGSSGKTLFVRKNRGGWKFLHGCLSSTVYLYPDRAIVLKKFYMGRQ